jgi:GT2 family glycosyltransferase
MEPHGNTEERFKLVICIAAHNVSGLLRQCLRSVFNSKVSFPFDVIVNDDGSSDDTSSMVKSEFPQVDVMRNEESLGFAKTNNQMLRRYSGRSQFYLLLNDDTVVESTAIQEIVDFADRHQDAGIVGGKVVRADGTLDWPCKRSFQTPSIFFYRALRLDKLFPESRRFGRYHLTYLDENATHEVDAVCGAFLMIRDQALQQVGPLDEAFFMYGEDMDWCFRAKSAGWKVYYYPKARIIHYKSQSIRKRSSRMICWWYRSTWMMYKKSLHHSYNPLTNWMVWIGMHGMLLLSLCANSLRPTKGLPSRG